MYRERGEILALEPPLDEIDMLCKEGWTRLDTCRPIGMEGAGEIPATAILAWAEHKAFDHGLTTLLLAVLAVLDGERADRMRSARVLKG